MMIEDKYPIIKIKKTEELEKCRHKAKMELSILRKYRFLKNLGMWTFNFALIYWFMSTFINEIRNNIWLVLPLWFVCFLSSAGIDHLLLMHYDNVVKRYNLEITDNFKSGSYIKFMDSIRKLLATEVESLGKKRYTLCEMRITQTDYVCQIIIFDKE